MTRMCCVIFSRNCIGVGDATPRAATVARMSTRKRDSRSQPRNRSTIMLPVTDPIRELGSDTATASVTGCMVPRMLRYATCPSADSESSRKAAFTTPPSGTPMLADGGMGISRSQVSPTATDPLGNDAGMMDRRSDTSFDTWASPSAIATVPSRFSLTRIWLLLSCCSACRLIGVARSSVDDECTESVIARITEYVGMLLSTMARENICIVVTDIWPTGCCTNVSVKNNGTKATTTWSAVVNTNGTTVYTTWNGTFSANSGNVTVSPISWNKVIQPGVTDTSIGFCANRPSGIAVALPVSITGTY